MATRHTSEFTRPGNSERTLKLRRKRNMFLLLQQPSLRRHCMNARFVLTVRSTTSSGMIYINNEKAENELTQLNREWFTYIMKKGKIINLTSPGVYFNKLWISLFPWKVSIFNVLLQWISLLFKEIHCSNILNILIK